MSSYVRTVVLGGVAALVAVTVASAAGSVTVRATENVTLAHTILVDQNGRSLYHLTSDRGMKVTCVGACAKAWPPVIVSGKAKAGVGITAAWLGTVKRPDGRLQATYKGFTLYRFGGDKASGDVNGQALEQKWYAVGSSGKLVKSVPEAAAGAGGSGSTGGGSTGGGSNGGYGY